MAQYNTYIDVLGNNKKPLVVSSFVVREDYNVGWNATVFVESRNSLFNIHSMMMAAIKIGVTPGNSVSLLMSLTGAVPNRGVTPTPTETSEGGDEGTGEPPGEGEGTGEEERELQPGDIIRLWPSIVTEVEPSRSPSNPRDIVLSFSLTDPITHLSARPIWGAYRHCSVAEMVGGVISLAAGGDGKPTLTPLVSGFPIIKVIDELRDELSTTEYGIATGETLGAWLGHICSLLGIRMQVRANLDDSVELVLSDKPPKGNSLLMHPIVGGPLSAVEEDRSDTNFPHGNIHISSIEGYPGAPARGLVLDDPLHGEFRRFGTEGAVGTVVTGTNISADEANNLSTYELSGIYTRMMLLAANSQQPGLYPGQSLSLGSTVAGIGIWQVVSVDHRCRAGNYQNSSTLARGDTPWHPNRPSQGSPVYITGTVDGGDDFASSEPVSRDRLGRIPVTMSFLPTAVGEDALLLEVADTDKDQFIRLDDFKEDAISDYKTNTEAWEEKLDAYRKNEYADPHPRQRDSDLTAEQIAARKKAKEQRDAALGYLAYKRAKVFDAADKDKDGYITERDAVTSDGLSTILSEENGQARLQAQLKSYREGTLESDFAADMRIDTTLLEEHEALFGTHSGDGEDPYAVQKKDAAQAIERWPPRIPLPITEPMASGTHGFISGHRHGDICRIAVHHPFSAEIVGFQYRNDRRINPLLVHSATGIVAEHNLRSAWSGIVFRPVPISPVRSTEE